MKRVLAAVAVALLTLGAAAAGAYDVVYRAEILPDQGIAKVSVAVAQRGGQLREVSFGFDPERLFGERAGGELSRSSEDGRSRLVWQPPEGGGTLRYSMRLDHVREDAEYDARCAKSWMLVRAEDLFPPMASRFVTGAQARASLQFRLPPKWSIAHSFAMTKGIIRIEQGDRKLDQPTGWILAGRIERVEAEVEGSRLLLAAPRSHDARLRDMLAFLRWTLPTLQEIFGPLPERIFVATAGDPMWRGGLSGPGSVYLHTDLPLVDDDGSSPLLHELVHTVTRARSAPGDDWIVEGLAEYYSREILRRSGAIDDDTYARTLDELREKANGVEELEGEASGAETALGVAFFAALDERIRTGSEGEHSLDDFASTLAGNREPIGRKALVTRIREVTGFDASELVETRIPSGASEGPDAPGKADQPPEASSTSEAVDDSS